MVRDANGQALTYLYFDDDRHRRALSGRLTSEEAKRIAANIAKLPELPLRVAKEVRK